MAKRYLNGLRLKNIITDLNMTLFDFAKLADTHPTYLSRLMTGKIPVGINLRRRLVDALNRFHIPDDSLFLPSDAHSASDCEMQRTGKASILRQNTRSIPDECKDTPSPDNAIPGAVSAGRTLPDCNF